MVYHSKTGNTKQLVQAFYAGAKQVDGIELTLLPALSPDVQLLEAADAVVWATPANFGTVSGALKYFFDEVFYELHEPRRVLPYLVVVSADSDATGAERDIDRIMRGFCFKKVQPASITFNPINQTNLNQLKELGQAFGEALIMGIY